MATYRLKAAIPAILDKFSGEKVPVTLPAGALLRESYTPLQLCLARSVCAGKGGTTQFR